MYLALIFNIYNIYMNLDYDNELNIRIESRNIPSAPLQPLYDFRPVMTKYTWFQSIEEKSIVPTKHYEYAPSKVFNPGNRAPINYFLQNIDKESTLRNQFMALQKSDQKEYVPDLNSTLYDNPMAYTPNYFSPTQSTNVNANNCQKDTSLFYNHIRTNSRK